MLNSRSRESHAAIRSRELTHMRHLGLRVGDLLIDGQSSGPVLGVARIEYAKGQIHNQFWL